MRERLACSDMAKARRQEDVPSKNLFLLNKNSRQKASLIVSRKRLSSWKWVTCADLGTSQHKGRR